MRRLLALAFALIATQAHAGIMGTTKDMSFAEFEGLSLVPTQNEWLYLFSPTEQYAVLGSYGVEFTAQRRICSVTFVADDLPTAEARGYFTELIDSFEGQYGQPIILANTGDTQTPKFNRPDEYDNVQIKLFPLG